MHQPNRQKWTTLTLTVTVTYTGFAYQLRLLVHQHHQIGVCYYSSRQCAPLFVSSASVHTHASATFCMHECTHPVCANSLIIINPISCNIFIAII